MSAFSLEESKASLLYLLYFTGYKLKCLRVSLSQTGIVWRQLCLSPGNLRSHLTIEMFHPEVERWHAQPQLLAIGQRHVETFTAITRQSLIFFVP